MKRVLTYGTFDTIHFGHILLLQRARSLGEHLTVGLSTDEFNARKGKKSYFTYEERKEMLEAICYVDEVIPGLERFAQEARRRVHADHQRRPVPLPAGPQVRGRHPPPGHRLQQLRRGERLLARLARLPRLPRGRGVALLAG